MEEKLNLLHLYTGEGKGKTTAAMGWALRALGQGRHVLIAQFMKTGRSGELAALKQLNGAHVYEAPPIGKFTFRMTPQEREAACEQQARALNELCELIDRERPGLTVLDELALTAQRGLVSEADMWRLIERGLSCGEVVVTGRYAPESLQERADYVSEIVKRRHPYDVGVHARSGIEF